MTFHKAIRRQTFQARRKHLSWCRQNESVKQIRDVSFSLIDALTLNSYLNYQCKNCFLWSFESPNKSVRSRSAFIQLVFSADSGSSTVMSRILDCGRIRWRKKNRRHAIKGRLKSSPQPSNIDILFVHWIARYRQNNPPKRMKWNCRCFLHNYVNLSYQSRPSWQLMIMWRSWQVFTYTFSLKSGGRWLFELMMNARHQTRRNSGAACSKSNSSLTP